MGRVGMKMFQGKWDCVYSRVLDGGYQGGLQAISEVDRYALPT